MPFDPSRYPPSFPYRLQLASISDKPVSNGQLVYHILWILITVWLRVYNAPILEIEELDDPSFLLYTVIRPIYTSPHHMNWQTLGYVLLDVISHLLDAVHWGFALQMIIYDTGFRPEAPVINMVVGYESNAETLVKGMPENNVTTSATPSRPYLVNGSIRADVEFTGTNISRRNIIYLFTKLLTLVFRQDRNDPVPPAGTGTLVTPDASARLQITSINSGPHGYVYLVSEMAQGIMEVLYQFARIDRWESATTAVRYHEYLFFTLTLDQVGSGLDGPTNSSNGTAVA